MRPKVYVTQETHYDFGPAEAFGDVVFITRADLNNMRNSKHNEAVVSQVKDAIKNFDPEVDWLVISGSPYITALVFMLLGRKRPQHVQILRWDNRDLRYVPLHIELRREIIAEMDDSGDLQSIVRG